MEKAKKIALAKSKYVRISQRKMIGVCNLVRGKDVAVVRAILIRTEKKGARIIEKTLDSAIANAKNKGMDAKNLFIETICADMGPAYKRSIPWSKGTARPIKKRTTHLTIILEEKNKKLDTKASSSIKIKEDVDAKNSDNTKNAKSTDNKKNEKVKISVKKKTTDSKKTLNKKEDNK